MTVWLVLAALPALALYLLAARYLWYAALALLAPPAPPPARAARSRFCVLIPAHNEGAGIMPTIDAARAFAYPADLFRVVVLADNCADDTAAVARAAAIEVAERADPERPGKGQAIAWFLARHLRPGEALVICDADSRPAPDYLAWMNRTLASGYGAAQGFNAAANADESGLAALAAITSTMKNALHYAGKTAAGRPVPLMNGLTLAAATLAAHPWRAFSIVEDHETYLHLVAAGVPLRFVREARIASPRAGRFKAAASQKQRWSGGQSALAREVARPLLWRGLRERSGDKVSAALDLILPGYAPTTGALIVVAAVAWLLLPPGAAATGFALAGLLAMIAQFAVGFWMLPWTPALWRGVALAPVYIVWKMLLAARAAVHAPRRWQRAQRDFDAD